MGGTTAEPRLWISLAGAGCLLAVSGLLVIAGDAQVSDDGGGGSTTPGILLFLLVVGAGYVLIQACRPSPRPAPRRSAAAAAGHRAWAARP
ncbi:MAG TPA: hypothetical protein VFZ79_12475 [Acidimicrobiales bacterium]